MKPRLLALTFLGFGVLSITPACDDATPGTPDPAPQCKAPSGPPTIHEAATVGDETWSADAGPHIVKYPLRLAAGATLTIEPCAEILFEPDAALVVDNEGSRLVAEGTDEQPITFRGKDGARWGVIHVRHPAAAVLRHVRLANGGSNQFSYNATLVASGDGLTPAKRPLLLEHVTIRDSIGPGVALERAAAFAEGSADLTITESGRDEHPYPIRMGEHAIGSVPTGQYTGNRKDELLIVDEGANQMGGLQEDATLRDRGVPYHFGDWRDASFRIGAGETAPLTTLTIEAGVTIRFEPGTRMEIEHSTGEFPASGAVRAFGTEAKPVVFTSGAAAPKAGDWGGLWFGGIARDTNFLGNVRIEYAGHDCGCILLSCNDLDGFEGAVIFSQEPPANFYFWGSSIAHIAGHGVVRGWRGTGGPDFLPGLSFEDVSGCKQTRPEIEGQPCPSPKPTCPE